jgi:hypothetical protein
MSIWHHFAFKSKIIAIAFAAYSVEATNASATPERMIILGDSIGVGLSMAGGVQRFATNSVAIRGTQILDQLRRLEPNQIAVVSLGTNDAVGSVTGVEKGIDQIVEYVNRRKLRLIWMGPPCVNKPWNVNVIMLDKVLRERLKGLPHVTYVSVSDQSYCDRTLRARDGVHFTMKGYGVLWDRVQVSSGIKSSNSVSYVRHSEHKTAKRKSKKPKKVSPPVKTRNSDRTGAR